MRQIVLDTETTGISWKQGHRIIEIGCVELIDRRETGNHYHAYLNPEREVDAGAFAVHGLSNIFLQDKPLFSEVMDKFMAYIKDSELLIHNASFDVGFLDYELNLLSSANKITDVCVVSDTLMMARAKHPGVRNSLDALCKRYYVDNSNRELHGALLDASLLAKVYLAMTGGQGTLFVQDHSESGGNSMDKQKMMSEKAWNLLITPLDAPMVQAHQDYLKQMQSAGACLWLEEEG